MDIMICLHYVCSIILAFVLFFSDVRSVYYVAPVPPFDPMGNVPSVSHQAPTAARPSVFLSPLDHTRNMLMRQIEYYFRYYMVVIQVIC